MARQPSTESDTRYFLRKLLTVYGPELMPAPRYVWREDRWNELVFSLLVQVSAVPQSIVRRTLGQMAELELLNVPELAGCTADRARPAASEPLWARSTELLVSRASASLKPSEGLPRSARRPGLSRNRTAESRSATSAGWLSPCWTTSKVT